MYLGGARRFENKSYEAVRAPRSPPILLRGLGLPDGGSPGSVKSIIISSLLQGAEETLPLPSNHVQVNLLTYRSRLFAVSLLLIIKTTSDKFYGNSYYARILELDLAQINRMEREMLVEGLNFNAYV